MLKCSITSIHRIILPRISMTIILEFRQSHNQHLWIIQVIFKTDA